MFFTSGGASLGNAICWPTRRGQTALSRKCSATALGKESADTITKELRDHVAIILLSETPLGLTVAQSRCCADWPDRCAIVIDRAVRQGRPDGILARIV